MYTSDISKSDNSNTGSKATYPELKMVVTKLISNSQGEDEHTFLLGFGFITHWLITLSVIYLHYETKSF